jgi:NAD(P)-dependent dehydrogenase (short-subunit alcohol dehydrogenase family)
MNFSDGNGIVPPSSQSLIGRVAIVTGASRGVGRALVEEFTREGAHVVAVARSAELLDELAAKIGAACIPFACDLTSSESVQKLARHVEDKWNRLDILVGNAAIMGPRTFVSALDEDGWAQVIDTNVTVNWRLVYVFDRLLRAGPAGRVVFMTSGSGSRAQMAPGRGAYAISKAALDALARTYASETIGSNVRVMLANPGPLRTSLRASVAPNEDPMSLRTPADFAPKVLTMCLASWTQSGRIYDFPLDKVMDFAGPS